MLNNIFNFFILIILVSSCSSLKETLSLQESKKVDEFLIKKKNPLVVPPEFSSLPKPVEEKINNEKQKNIDLSKILQNDSDEKISNDVSNELETSILDILQDNDSN